jgi:hypothetical protein
MVTDSLLDVSYLWLVMWVTRDYILLLPCTVFYQIHYHLWCSAISHLYCNEWVACLILQTKGWDLQWEMSVHVSWCFSTWLDPTNAVEQWWRHRICVWSHGSSEKPIRCYTCIGNCSRLLLVIAVRFMLNYTL